MMCARACWIDPVIFTAMPFQKSVFGAPLLSFLARAARLLAFLPLALPAAVPAPEASEAALFQQLVRAPDAPVTLKLAGRGRAGLPYLRQGLQSGGRVAALCAWALWQQPQPEAAPDLRGLLWQPDQVASYWAAKTLGRMPSPENAAALARLLADERLGYWELAAGGVPRLRDLFVGGRREVVPAEAWMPNLRAACAAMESLGGMAGTGPVAGAALLKALESDQHLIRYAAARGLGALRDPAAAPKLEALSRADPVLMVRLAARQALAVLNDPAARGVDLASVSPAWRPSSASAPKPPEPAGLVFIKTSNRSAANLGFRDSYYFPLTPKYHSGENLYLLSPPQPDGVLKNLTGLTHGEVQGPQASFDGKRILFAMRPNKETDGFHLFEINADGSGLRQITTGNCNDVDPAWLPDGRIVFCSDRAGYQEYYHQERSRVIYTANADGSGMEQITFNPNQDYAPVVLQDGRVLYDSYRFYAQDGSEGPMRGEFMGLARIETVLRSVSPDGAGDQLFYGSMRGAFYCPLRPMPFTDQWAGWHGRGYHVGVAVSQAREMPGGRLVCVTPAGLTLLDPDRLPLDCEIPVWPEVVNLAGGERVYMHAYDEMNPVGRFTSPSPAGGDWVYVSHAPWHDLRQTGYGLYLLNTATRQMELVYDDPALSDVDPVPLIPRPAPSTRPSTRSPGTETGRIYCNSVQNTDLPFDAAQARYVRVLEGVLMGQSIAANAAFRTRLLATIPLHRDGSFYVEVPADTPVHFELLDANGRMLAHETEFNYVRPGETKGCPGCHEPAWRPAVNRRPLALDNPAASALRQRGDLIYFGLQDRPYNAVHRP